MHFFQLDFEDAPAAVTQPRRSYGSVQCALIS